ncbi:unnamed protein product [Amoebophrya sp. A25]|nr:unnamed protein product [Amoebophrya sp. A25]|eukprot:GSA25T00022018001.1
MSLSLDIGERLGVLRATFRSGKTRTYDWRLGQLKQLDRFLSENADAICESCAKDLGRHANESHLNEVCNSYIGVRKAMDDLGVWMRPQRVQQPLEMQPGRAEYAFEPKGVVLIIPAWNYPVALLVDGVCSAIAAGNCVVAKPSEISSHTEKLLAEKLPQYLDPEAFVLLTGGAEVSQALLSEHQFAHIVFTGAEVVAQKIASNQNVTRNLTPLTLELGGKNPAVILPSALYNDGVGLWASMKTAFSLAASELRGMLQSAALHSSSSSSITRKRDELRIPKTGKNLQSFKVLLRRLLKGKTTNCGQICMSPDYILIPHEMLPDLIAVSREIIREGFGANARTSDSYCRIVNANHFRRLQRLKETHSGEVIHLFAEGVEGQPADEKERFFPFVFMINPNMSDPVMKEEVFGPILPVVTYTADDVGNSTGSLSSFLNDKIAEIHSSPLMTYIFGFEDALTEEITRKHQSGNVMVNNTLLTFGHENLPFGGIGRSGTGRQHGRAGFEELSYRRTYFRHYVLPFGLELLFMGVAPWDRFGPLNSMMLPVFRAIHPARKLIAKYGPRIFKLGVFAYLWHTLLAPTLLLFVREQGDIAKLTSLQTLDGIIRALVATIARGGLTKNMSAGRTAEL